MYIVYIYCLMMKAHNKLLCHTTDCWWSVCAPSSMLVIKTNVNWKCCGPVVACCWSHCKSCYMFEHIYRMLRVAAFYTTMSERKWELFIYVGKTQKKKTLASSDLHFSFEILFLLSASWSNAITICPFSSQWYAEYEQCSSRNQGS